jgi:hypothetical protein
LYIKIQKNMLVYKKQQKMLFHKQASKIRKAKTIGWIQVSKTGVQVDRDRGLGKTGL